MKKTLLLTTISVVLFMIFINIFPKTVQATDVTINPEGSHLVELKENQAKTLEEYKEKYNSDAYGLTAYILHFVQVYSIPFCFVGLAISIIYRVVLGTRHLENAEKGLGMMVSIITLTIICQVLPLIFAVVVKLGKE